MAEGAGEDKATGNVSAVFISYASPDGAVAGSVCGALEHAGVSCWLAPRDVMPGDFYGDAIVHAIDAAKVVVLILSQHSVGSPHVLREVERASSKRHPVVSLRTDQAPLPAGLEYFLNTSQWLDSTTLGMDAALPKLVQAVQRIVAPAPVVEPTHSGDATRLVASPQSQPCMGAQEIRRPSRPVIALSAVIALGLAYVVADKFWISKHSVSERPVSAAASAASSSATMATERSVAVLPFTDMSEQKDQEYFADGIAEEILDLLVKIPGLKVIGRTSSFQFKGQNIDLRTVGDKLGANYVLEGSVRKSGGRLRVTAQLIDSRDGTHLMSETYDRDMGDVLKMQDEIAATLVRALQLTVSPDSIVPRPALRNTEAYNLYLRARHAYDRFDQQGFEQAASDCKRALALDPSLAVAAALQAVVYDALGEWGFMSPAVAFEQARRAAEHALELDPNQAVPHAVLGSISDVYDWDWAASDREIAKALAIAPNDATILFIAARQTLITGNWDEALTLLNGSLAQDPLNPASHMGVNWVQVRRGRLEEAEAAARRTLEISPTYSYAHYFRGIAMLLHGEREAALAEFSKESDPGGRLGGLAMAYSALGRKAESDHALGQMLKEQADDNAFGIAEVYAYRGAVDSALRWLDRAYDQKDPSLYYVKGDPPLQRIAADPRYRAFLRKMKLPE